MSVSTLRDGTGPVSAASRERQRLICFSHLRWNFVFQRPQQILTRAARNFDVSFFEEPVLAPCTAPRLERVSLMDGIEVLVPILPSRMPEEERAEVQRVLLDEVLDDNDPKASIGWYYTPAAIAFSAHIPFAMRIYDCMDELACFKFAPKGLPDLEQQLLAQSDIVFTGGASLYEAKRALHDNVYLFPSSIDRAHFAPARSRALPEPPDLAPIPHPRIGFFGVLDERLDLDLVASLAAARGDWHLVMIGPVAKIDPATLPQRANIHWLGQKSYAELPAYLAHIDAGWMPFALNDATRYISPTKTPEFLAAGLPVASTPVTDVVRAYGTAGLVEIAHDGPAMVKSIESLFPLRSNRAWLSRVDRHLASMSWDQTWMLMRGEITRVVSDSRRPAADKSSVSWVSYV